MPRSFHSTSGIAYPGDLKLLNDVFDRLCREHGLENGSAAAEQLGRAAMSLFAAGVVEEADLVDSLAAFLRRRTRFVPSPMPLGREPAHRLGRRL